MSDRTLRLAAGLVALAGVAVAGYLTWAHFADSTVLCVAGGGCETVQESEYAEIAGIPVAVLGLGAYATILALVVWDSVGARLAAASLAFLGFLFSLYLLVLQLFVIEAVCIWCMANDVVIAPAARAADGAPAPVVDVALDAALWRAAQKLAREVDALVVRSSRDARLQPAAVRGGGASRVPASLRGVAEAGGVPRHEPGPLGHGADRRPVRRGRGRARLARISAEIGKPEREHPKRPVEGFACARSEVSGARLWGAFAERYVEPEHFFRERFVANYCPLVFMEASGRNRTPDRLPAAERRGAVRRVRRPPARALRGARARSG